MHVTIMDILFLSRNTWSWLKHGQCLF